MFGHQNDQKKQDEQPIQDLLSAPALDGVLQDSHPSDFNPALPPTNNQPQPAGSPSPAQTFSPLPTLHDDLDLDDPAPQAPVIPTPQPLQPEFIQAPAPVVTPTPVATSAPITPVDPAPVAAGGDDLLNIKQQALDQLSPLVNHLEQTPEEKFHTTMMMIQANDNQDLIKTAYEVALTITDEKIRAKALLDIVNEINYFTQHQSSQTDLLV